jgi:hypothetical protein
LEIIAGFGELERFGIDGTRVTDAGLAKLARLKHLRELYVISISGNGNRSHPGQQ